VNDVKDPDKPMLRREFKITVTVTGKWILKPNSETGKRAGGTETTTSRANSGNLFDFKFPRCTISSKLSHIHLHFSMYLIKYRIPKILKFPRQKINSYFYSSKNKPGYKFFNLLHPYSKNS
jgi:hypothetical protein